MLDTFIILRLITLKLRFWSVEMPRFYHLHIYVYAKLKLVSLHDLTKCKRKYVHRVLVK